MKCKNCGHRIRKSEEYEFEHGHSSKYGRDTIACYVGNCKCRNPQKGK